MSRGAEGVVRRWSYGSPRAGTLGLPFLVMDCTRGSSVARNALERREE